MAARTQFPRPRGTPLCCHRRMGGGAASMSLPLALRECSEHPKD
jgi:hypothetical protein